MLKSLRRVFIAINILILFVVEETSYEQLDIANKNKYNVIKIDLNSEYQNTEDTANLIKILTEDIKREMRAAFPSIDFAEDDTLARCILKVTSDEVEKLCKDHDVDYNECRHWYDGYSQHGFEIYNPESVVMSLETKSFESFLGRTSTYEAVAERIRMNFEGTKDAVIRMLSGETVDINVTRYMNTMPTFMR